jgi:hypothetical protein
MADQQARMSRFNVKYSDQELLQMVTAIANAVNPNDPLSTTQKQFDDNRESAGFPGAPRAFRIAARLKRSWAEVLRLSQANPRSQSHALGARRVSYREKLTKAEVEHYLQAATRYLGTKTVRVSEYDEYRQGLIDEDNRRYLHRDGLDETMPTSLTIIQVAGSWEEALKWAGLENPTIPRKKLYPADQALDDFIADYGFAPMLKMLVDYQAKRRLVTEGYTGDFRAWRDEQLRTGIASRHGKVQAFTHIAQAPKGWEETPITPAPDGYHQRRRGEVDLEACKEALMEAIQLAEGKRLTQDLYQRLSKNHQLVSLVTIQRVAKREADLTWGQLRDQVVGESARQQRRQKRRSN